MNASAVDHAVLSEETWRTWVQKNRLRDQATARRVKLLAGIFLILLALASGFYLLSMR